jgi:hypothetical protein
MSKCGYELTEQERAFVDKLRFYFTGFAWGFILSACISTLVIINLR